MILRVNSLPETTAKNYIDTGDIAPGVMLNLKSGNDYLLYK
jgi:hypothetical protein